MRILVTGAKGFVGRNLCAQLKNIKDGKARNYCVSVTEETNEQGRCCRVLGKAGLNLGGMTLDRWIYEEALRRLFLSENDPRVRSCSGDLLRYCEENKKKLPINPTTGEPFYLHSRVGLNTGNMVVGNMGTEKKLNYTIMGNNVNLASRLEGTNKVYGSWIMVSESTWLEADSGENKGKLIARAFDAVRVINVKKPVRIYNIIGLRDELSSEQIRATEIFNEGTQWYMKGSETPDVPKDRADLEKAYELYKKAAELYPADKSSEYFMSRCETFLLTGIPAVWDGVFTMKTK